EARSDGQHAGVAHDRHGGARLPGQQQVGLVELTLGARGVDHRDSAADREPPRELLGARVAALELGRRLADHVVVHAWLHAADQVRDAGTLERLAADLGARCAMEARGGGAGGADPGVDRAGVVVGAGYGSTPPRIHFAAAYRPSRSTCVRIVSIGPVWRT